MSLWHALPRRAEAGKASLQLVVVLGRESRQVRLADQAGRHGTQLDVSELAGGVYFLRLVAAGKVRTQRLTAVR
jgi:hypothetical protein